MIVISTIVTLVKMRNNQGANQAPKMITINFWSILSHLISMGFHNAFLIFYTYSYATMDTSLRSDSLSKCFFAYIILAWIPSINGLVKLLYMFMYYDRTLPEETWEHILPIKRYPLKLTNMAAYGTMGLATYSLQYSFHSARDVVSTEITCVHHSRLLLLSQ